MKSKTLLIGTVLIVLLAPNLYSQGQQADSAFLELQILGKQLEAKTESKWHISFDRARMCAQSLNGEYETGIQVKDKETAESLSRNFLQEYHELLRVEGEDFQTVNVNFNPVFGRFKIDFQQYYENVRVETGRTRVFIRENGSIYSVRNGFHPGIEISTTPAIGEENAVVIARELMTEPSGSDEPPEVELVIFPVTGDSSVSYFLCWKIRFDEYTFFIDAHDGRQIDKWSNYTYDVTHSGTIQGTTYPLTDPDGATSLTPLEYIYIWLDKASPSGSNSDDETNSLGNYNVTLADKAATFYTRLQSEKVRVLNHQGAEIEDTYNYGTPTHDYDFPDSPGNQANVYFNIIRAWNRFNNIFGHEQPFITADANNNDIGSAWGNTNGTTVRYQPIIGRYSWTIQHEFTHCVVFDVNGGSWINFDGDDDWWCMDEAFPTYFPCVFNGTSMYTTPDGSHDLSTSTGIMTIQDEDGNGTVNEEDHHYYFSRYPVAGAWWDLRSSLGEAALHALMWDALENLQPPNSHRHPRDFFNELLLADDDDNDAANGTPHLSQINSAYKNHGMNYYPEVFSANGSGTETNKFLVADKIYCKGSGFPTNQQVRIYVVQNSDSWTNNASLADVSGGYETIDIGGNGDLPVTEIWETSDADAGSYDIVVDVDRDGTYDFDFDGIIDAGDDLHQAGFAISAGERCMDFEGGPDAAAISSTIPGMFFTTTQGFDWIYGDKTTGKYNVYPYGNGGYVCNGNVFAWLGPAQGKGRIDFTGATARKISMLTSTYSGLWLRAYDENGQLLDSDYAPNNHGTHQLSGLTVSAPSIAYVLVHDAGNYWLIDDLCVEDLLGEAKSFLAEGEQPGTQILDVMNQAATVLHSFNNPTPGILHLILHWFGSEMSLTAYQPDGSVYGTWQSSLPPINIVIDQAASGMWQFEITAVDVPEDDYPYAFVVGIPGGQPSPPLPDVTPPVVVIHSPVDGKCYFNTNPIHFGFSAEDPESGIAELTAVLDGTTPIQDGQDTLIETLGSHSFYVVAVNGAGLADTAYAAFTVNGFRWLAPITRKDSLETETVSIIRNSTLPIKFTVFDSTEEFVADTTVRVVIEGTTAEFHYGQRDTCVRIDVEDPEEAKYIVNLHTNFKHWNYGIQIGEPYWIKTFFDDILAHKVRIIVVDPPAAKEAFDEQLPTAFALRQNYPNPFNPTTEISFSLPEATNVKLEIFNIMGQKVATVANRHFVAGNHTIEWNDSQVASGVYFYRLDAGDYSATRKMILLK